MANYLIYFVSVMFSRSLAGFMGTHGGMCVTDCVKTCKLFRETDDEEVRRSSRSTIIVSCYSNLNCVYLGTI